MNRAALILDPRIKFIAWLVAILLFISTYFPAASWKAAGFFFCLLLAFWLISDNRIYSLRRFWSIGLFFISLLIFLAIVVLIFSPQSFDLKLKNFFDLSIKTFLVIMATFIFILDSDFGDFIRAFYLWHIPSGFLAMLTFAHRYFQLFQLELISVFRAKLSRSPKRRSFFEELKITGLILHQYLLRLLERSEKIYAALLSRGFQGRLEFLGDLKLRKNDFAFLFVFIFVLAIIKIL